MTRDQVVELVRDFLGFNSSLDEAIILRHMDAVQAGYEDSEGAIPLPWFRFRHEHTQTVNSANASLPDDFIDFDEEWAPSVTYNGSTYGLKRTIPEDIVTYQSVTPAVPKAFVYQRSSLVLIPAPVEAMTLNLPYYQRSLPLSQDDDNSWFEHFPNLIAIETAWRIAKATRDESVLSWLKNDRDEAKHQYFIKVEARKHRFQSYILADGGF